MEFGLGRIHDESESYEEAFRHYAEGKALVKRQRELAGEWYDHDRFRAGVDRMIDTFTLEFFAARRDWGDPSERPVFVVGMPRSGTTLVHQIAASHSQVHGAGELNLLQQIEGQFGGDQEKLTVARWGQATVKQAARAYLTHLGGINTTALRVVDKMPGNAVRLAQIGVLLPHARVIICRRDPRDTCLSCFFQWFTQGLNWSLDLADCGRYHVEIDRLIAHWIKVQPVAIMEMQYEALVNDLEGQSRRLIEFLGLPWEPACLEFYRARPRSSPPASGRSANRSTRNQSAAGNITKSIWGRSLKHRRPIRQGEISPAAITFSAGPKSHPQGYSYWRIRCCSRPAGPAPIALPGLAGIARQSGSGCKVPFHRRRRWGLCP